MDLDWIGLTIQKNRIEQQPGSNNDAYAASKMALQNLKFFFTMNLYFFKNSRNMGK
jgi:hypothetical protein